MMFESIQLKIWNEGTVSNSFIKKNLVYYLENEIPQQIHQINCIKMKLEADTILI